MGDAHTLRRIDGANTVMRIGDAFANDTVYMADGHHRYESALDAIDDRPASRYVLMGIACADDPALVVGATHRIVLSEAPGQPCSPSLAATSALPESRPGRPRRKPS